MTSPPPSAPPLPQLDSSFFPNPPLYYSAYTPSALAQPQTSPELLPPNPQSIRLAQSYSVFGETWPIVELAPDLQQMGLTQLFQNTTDRATSLTTLLHALLVTYASLVTSLMAPPPRQDDTVPPPPQLALPEQLVDHIRLISINMHYLINQLRPVQARETLKSMLRQQIDTRRAKTIAIKQRCSELSATLLTARSEIESSRNHILIPGEDARPVTVVRSSREEDYERIRTAVESIEKEVADS